MDWKSFFRPNKVKISIFIIILILGSFMGYLNSICKEGNYDCPKNKLFNLLGVRRWIGLELMYHGIDIGINILFNPLILVAMALGFLGLNVSFVFSYTWDGVFVLSKNLVKWLFYGKPPALSFFEVIFLFILLLTLLFYYYFISCAITYFVKKRRKQKI